MLHLTHKTLSAQTQNHLNARQADIDSKALFDIKAERAGTLWDSKTANFALRPEMERVLPDIIWGSLSHFLTWRMRFIGWWIKV